MRKYLDIPMTLIVTVTLTVAMLWPLEAPPPAPEGSDKIVHFIAFAALVAGTTAFAPNSVLTSRFCLYWPQLALSACAVTHFSPWLMQHNDFATFPVTNCSYSRFP